MGLADCPPISRTDILDRIPARIQIPETYTQTRGQHFNHLPYTPGYVLALVNAQHPFGPISHQSDQSTSGISCLDSDGAQLPTTRTTHMRQRVAIQQGFYSFGNHVISLQPLPTFSRLVLRGPAVRAEMLSVWRTKQCNDQSPTFLHQSRVAKKLTKRRARPSYSSIRLTCKPMPEIIIEHRPASQSTPTDRKNTKAPRLSTRFQQQSRNSSTSRRR